MQAVQESESLLLTENQIVPVEEPLERTGRQNPRARRTPTNPRDALWNCDDPILGLSEETIEDHAHAYRLNGHIRSTGSFEAFLRARLLSAWAADVDSGGQ